VQNKLNEKIRVGTIRRAGIQPSRAADAFMAEMHKLISNS
jgi:hypothetical protein